MVYGGPSRGCQTCRTRHIKCDEARPQCQNCFKRQQPCPGYRDEFDIMLKDQTAIVPEKARKRSAARGKQRASREKSPIVPRPLSRATEVDALCFFFTSYVTVARDPLTSTGFLEYLLPLYSNARHESPLSLATSAVAVLIASCWSGKGPDTHMSYSLFGKALNLTKTAIDDRMQNTTDETLVTVLMLEFYDELASRAKSQRSAGSHHGGAVALVKHRGYLNFQTEQSKRLLIAVRHQLIDFSLQKGMAINLDPAIWNDAAPMPQTPAIQLNALTAEMANLQALTSTFQFPPPPAPISRSPSPSIFHASEPAVEVLHSMLAPALDLDARLATWTKSVPTFWNPITVSSSSSIHPSIETAGMYGSSCDVYPSLHVASIWNSHRITRIAVLLIILKCHRSLISVGYQSYHVPEATRKYVITMIQGLVDSVCASVPFHLGNRVESAPLEKTDGVYYPQIADDDELNFQICPTPNALGYSISMSKEEHIRIAAALGGYFLLGPFGSILGGFAKLRTFEAGLQHQRQQETGERSESGSPAAQIDPQLSSSTSSSSSSTSLLRDGQIEWILQQLQRIKKIYKIVGPSLSPSPAPSSSSNTR